VPAEEEKSRGAMPGGGDGGEGVKGLEALAVVAAAGAGRGHFSGEDRTTTYQGGGSEEGVNPGCVSLCGFRPCLCLGGAKPW
jgi:hypothetical protein